MKMMIFAFKYFKPQYKMKHILIYVQNKINNIQNGELIYIRGIFFRYNFPISIY